METDTATSLRELRDRARGPVKRITTFGPEAYADVESVLGQFDATLTHEYLPIPESDSYLTVRSGDRHLGSVSAAALGDLRDPVERPPWDTETRESAYRELVSLLSGTTFVMDDRRRLVATAREIEDRAYRHGRGRLSVTFQSLSAFRAQVPAYRRLVGSTDLEVVVFGTPDWEPPPIENVTVEPDTTGELTEFWVVAFDGDGADGRKCAMIAEEADPDEYTGVVTYDPAVVDDLIEYLERAVD
ncbi:DICT sensory domain-containing protein [Halosimplex salinum]|uniref:DICT sensory domain-containing protein n=1 Tax=Halosimplex salinum TaxID=1710538 RepID=UPI000F48EE6E|nr:DICT sensory domain-containing protein [Halosimplex salinum]